MKLDAPFIQLPLRFDAPALAGEITALGESAWKPHPQGFPGNSMLPLVAVEGEPDNESFAGEMRPTPHLMRCPYLVRTLASLGATVGRTRLMRLSGQAEVTRHADQGYYWVDRVRVHVPVLTQPTVRFECDGEVIHMAAGECWIFDTWRSHSVQNDANEARIHLVCDTVGGSEFWNHVADGRRHDAPHMGWEPRLVSPESARAPSVTDIAFESRNVPAVMSPWELEKHLGFLLQECRPHPQLAVLHQHVQRLLQQWRGLWARYGDAAQGRESFRQAMDAFVATVRPQSKGVTLVNEMPWMQVVVVMIARVAVQATGARSTHASPGEYA